jgi:hypothetical protein
MMPTMRSVDCGDKDRLVVFGLEWMGMGVMVKKTRKCSECGRAYHQKGSICRACADRGQRQRVRLELGGQSAYGAASADPKFVARLDRRIAEATRDAKGCLIWPRMKRNGYGMMCYRGLDLLAHRLVAIRAGKAKASDPEIIHSCDNPPCIEQEHLSGGTHGDNMADMVAKGRASYGVTRFPLTAPRASNTSGLTGIYQHPTTGRWRARVNRDGKIFHLGYFATKAEAASFRAGVCKHQGWPI